MTKLKVVMKNGESKIVDMPFLSSGRFMREINNAKNRGLIAMLVQGVEINPRKVKRVGRV
ncbi:hypothetical protein [Salinicoccus roseus]|uniref:hypothetical protein n=1 Tax=Salinicoccus roseus TaxID=45670 RepID=UPI001585D24F|nr:hypothetical protein [Salinicoccus roseus]